MSDSAGTGFVEILPRTDKFSSSLSREIDPALQQAGTNASNLAGKASTAFAALGVVAVGAITKGISATTDWASEIRSLQRVTGQSAEEASGLAAAGNQLGLSTSTLAQSFGLLGKNIVNGSANLEKYGIATKDAEGNTLPFNEILGNVSDKFLTLPKGVEQAAFAQNVFGRSGKALIPILSQGSAGIADLVGNAEDLGLVMSQEDVDAAKELSFAQRELGLAFKGASIAIGQTFVPILTTVVSGITQVVEIIQLIPAPITAAVVGFTALAGGAAALGKGIGFLTSGWSQLGGVFDSVSRFTGIATTALEENTVATVTNTDVQVGLEAAAGSATSTIQATASVIEAGTTAIESNTVATEANVIATETSSAAQVGAAAASAKWATQLRALNAVANEGVISKVFGPGAAAAIGGVTAALARFVPVATLAFGAFKGFQEFNQIKEGNFAQAFNTVADAAQHFGIEFGHAVDPERFKEGIGAIQQGLADGTLTTDTATKAIEELASATGVENVNAAALVTEMEGVTASQEKAAIAAEKHTKALFLQRHSIDGIVDGSKTLTNVFDLMGTSAGQFEKDARTAFRESDKAFRVWAQDFRRQAVDAWRQFQDAASSSLNFVEQTVGDLGTDLEEGEHLTAQSILRQFNQAAQKTKAFGRDLLEVSKIGGAAAKDLANSLLESGNVLAAQVIANAPEKLQNQIVSSFGKGEDAADSFATKLTRSIVGPLQDIAGILEAIAKKWGIDLEFLDHGAQRDIDKIHQSLAGLPSVTTLQVHLETTGGGQSFHPLPTATGGIIHGQSGFVTRGPVFQVGEGSSQTFAGKGAEAVIPLNERGIAILAEAMRRASRDQHVHVTFGVDETGNLQVRRIARDEIDRENDFRARVVR